MNYYYHRSDSYSIIWTSIEEIQQKYGRKSSEFWTMIYSLNHIGYHKSDCCYDTVDYINGSDRLRISVFDNIPYDSGLRINSQQNINTASKIRDHRLSDSLCLNYQKSWFELKSVESQQIAIQSMFSHITPWNRFWRWIRNKLHFESGVKDECFLGINIKRFAVALYTLSRLISMLFTVNICNWILFSYPFDINHDNMAIGVMRIIGICYLLLMLIWIYYLIALYSVENLVGFIINAKCRAQIFDQFIQDPIQNTQQFCEIMKINQAVS